MKSQNKTFFGITLSTSAIVLGLTNPARAASFQGLGDLPGRDFYSEAYGVSGDGSVVVGFSVSARGEEAFRWTPSGGMVGLGDLPGGYFGSYAYGASGDGSVVVGRSYSASGGSSSASGNEAFRWTTSGGMVGLGDLPGGSFDSEAYGVSGDGSVVVGYGISARGQEAFRWTTSGGMVGLGYLPGGGSYSIATGVSGDGSVVVGRSYFPSGWEAFRWTTSGGMVGLGYLPGGGLNSQAYGVSGDGSVVVGLSVSANGNEAFRWTTSGGMVGLGDLPGGVFNSIATGVSDDGSVVVGQGTSVVGQGTDANGYEASLWTPSGGMRSLKDVLTTDFGLNLTGWKLFTARGISADGLTIVGYGSNPSGQGEAWIARLDPTTNPPPKSVPEPSNVLGLGLLGLGLAATKMKGVLSKKIKSPTDNPQEPDS